MKLPSYLRINKADYPEESRAIVDRLASSLNIGIESLFNLGNNRISLPDNVACVVKDVTLTVNSLGVPVTASGIALGSTIQTVLGSTVIRAENQTDSTVFPTAQPFVTYTQNGTTYEIDHVAGIPANYQFLLRIVVWGA